MELSALITLSQLLAEVRRVHGEDAARTVKELATLSGHLPFHELELRVARSLIVGAGLPPDAYNLEALN